VTGKPLLRAEGLRVEIPTRRGVLVALDGVSFAIAAGEVLGFVGESGAGKSLTGMAILGLLDAPGRVAAGEVWLGERRIDSLSQREMRRVRGREIGAVFQDPLMSLNPLLQIGEQLVETIQTHLPVGRREAVERALALMRAVGIPAAEARFSAYPHQFSGGMRQRIVIALALCAEPRLIVADEPTTALDVSIQAQVLQLLKNMCRERGTAMLLVTHDMGVIAETADRVCVMYAGRIVETGAVEEVIGTPVHPYTRGLMAAIPTLAAPTGMLAQIDGAMPRLNARPAGCAFHPRCKDAVARCREESPPVEALGQRRVACWVAMQDGVGGVTRGTGARPGPIL
jgi:peptide/nickel transport system ATP-binding protein